MGTGQPEATPPFRGWEMSLPLVPNTRSSTKFRHWPVSRTDTDTGKRDMGELVGVGEGVGVAVSLGDKPSASDEVGVVEAEDVGVAVVEDEGVVVGVCVAGYIKAVRL